MAFYAEDLCLFGIVMVAEEEVISFPFPFNAG